MRVFGFEEHLCAGVRDGLVGVDRVVELLVFFCVGDCYFGHVRGDVDRFGCCYYCDCVPGVGEVGSQFLVCCVVEPYGEQWVCGVQ